jgi:hypothetical protein
MAKPAPRVCSSIRLGIIIQLSVIVLLFTMSGCVQLAEVDSTAAPQFKDSVGDVYTTVQDLEAFGIRRKIAKNVRDADYILVLSPRGIGGPEVTKTEIIPAGTRMKIVGVMTHKSKLFPATMYVVSLENFTLSFGEGKEIRIDDAIAFRMYEKSASVSSAPKLNPEFFRTESASR